MIERRRYRIFLFSALIPIGMAPYIFPESILDTEFAKTFGSSLSTSGFIALLIEAILNDEFLRVIKKYLSPSLQEIESGLDAGPIFRKNFEKAQKRIDIMALTCRVHREAYGERFFIDVVENTHCQIRIIIMEPESEMLAARALDEPDRKATKRMKKDIESTVKFFKALEKECKSKFAEGRPPGSIRVRMSRGIPYRGYTRIDDHCFISPYLSEKYGFHSPVIEINTPKSFVFSELRKQFNILWTRANNNRVIDVGEFDDLSI